MLFNLFVENVALIEQADIRFGEGFNVLTGETGAGKSILIGSVNMLLGERMGRDIIRNGENYAYVEGLFYLTPDEIQKLKEQELTPEEDGTFIVSRRLSADGKNICKAGGRTIPVSKLKEIGNILIDIHGQHDNQALLNGASHIGFLDASVAENDKDIFLEYHTTYAELKEAEKKLAEICMDENEKSRKLDVLNYEINEIADAALTVGEEEKLKEKRSMLKNKASIQSNCSAALDALYENSEGICAYNFLSEAHRSVETAAQGDSGLGDAAEKLSEALYIIEDVINSVRSRLDMIDTGEYTLDEIEQRLDVLYRLKRKYGDSEEEILAYQRRAEEELESLTSYETKKLEIENVIQRLKEKAHTLAERCHRIREKTAKEIEGKINDELFALSMEKATFQVHFEECDLGKHGVDKVEFLLSTNPGEPPKPLNKIVSGGELSRIMLALKNILTAGDAVDTLVFDEIDSGISGRVARKVGKKLFEISKKKQVLCVTHLPQIASLSECHYKISKIQGAQSTNTTVSQLDEQEKISEIAFMIGGDRVSETTLAQAKEMIAQD